MNLDSSLIISFASVLGILAITGMVARLREQVMSQRSFGRIEQSYLRFDGTIDRLEDVIGRVEAAQLPSDEANAYRATEQIVPYRRPGRSFRIRAISSYGSAVRPAPNIPTLTRRHRRCIHKDSAARWSESGDFYDTDLTVAVAWTDGEHELAYK